MGVETVPAVDNQLLSALKGNLYFNCAVNKGKKKVLVKDIQYFAFSLDLFSTGYGVSDLIIHCSVYCE